MYVYIYIYRYLLAHRTSLYEAQEQAADRGCAPETKARRDGADAARSWSGDNREDGGDDAARSHRWSGWRDSFRDGWRDGWSGDNAARDWGGGDAAQG